MGKDVRRQGFANSTRHRREESINKIMTSAITSRLHAAGLNESADGVEVQISLIWKTTILYIRPRSSRRV
jgi:hypothetical protein